MTGAQAESWRKFRFATTPAWAYLFLLLLCTGIGLLIVFILMYAVARRASGHLPLTRTSSQKVALATWIPVALIVGSVAMGFTALIVAAAGSSSSSHGNGALVYTTWVADTLVTNGPQRGYKPAFSGLTGNDIESATPSVDENGKSWVVNVLFTSRGAQQFAALTRANVDACPGDPTTDPKADCPERYMALWLGLTQEDIDAWDNATYVNAVTKPLSAGGKFIADPITLQEVSGGTATISGGYTQKQAQELASAMELQSTTTNPAAVAIAWVLAGLALLAFLAGLVGVLLLRRLIGPQGTVMKPQPGYYGNLVEIRNVHPAFVQAVLQRQHLQATQSPPPPTSPSPALPQGST